MRLLNNLLDRVLGVQNVCKFSSARKKRIKNIGENSTDRIIAEFPKPWEKAIHNTNINIDRRFREFREVCSEVREFIFEERSFECILNNLNSRTEEAERARQDIQTRSLT